MLEPASGAVVTVILKLSTVSESQLWSLWKGTQSPTDSMSEACIKASKSELEQNTGARCEQDVIT